MLTLDQRPAGAHGTLEDPVLQVKEKAQKVNTGTRAKVSMEKAQAKRLPVTMSIPTAETQKTWFKQPVRPPGQTN